MNKVSIVLSTYNQSQYIRETIESILAQTYNDYELIVVNDNPTTNDNIDETSRIVAECIKNIPEIYVYRTNNIGLSKTRNYGAKESKGQYLLFMDGDDKIDPTFLEKSIAVLESDPKLGFVYTDTQHFDGADTFWEQPEYDFNMLLHHNYICSCSLMRRDAYDKAGGYDENNFGYYEDYQFWIKLGSLGWYGKHIPEKLFYYRIHQSSGMQSNRNKAFGEIYKMYIITQFPNLYHPDIVQSAKNMLSMYPEKFMTFTPQQQEKYLEELQ